MNTAKTVYLGLCAAFATVGSIVVRMLGGWDAQLQTMLWMMAIDYSTGIIVALVFKKSQKSENGAFESKASLKGLFRKCAMLACVMMAFMLDSMAGAEGMIRTGVILFFIANDGFSIIENMGIMGVPMPPILKNAFEALKSKETK